MYLEGNDLVSGSTLVSGRPSCSPLGSALGSGPDPRVDTQGRIQDFRKGGGGVRVTVKYQNVACLHAHAQRFPLFMKFPL